MPPVRSVRAPQDVHVSSPERPPCAAAEIAFQAINVEASNAKILGKRCTALLNAGEYTAALQDAKSLVRILPDAPVGYLKAARCYRLVKKLKAAQRMLDMAVERAEDEGTIRAIRTEQRKIAEGSEKIARERSRPFSDHLPEEIFLHIASYLSQQDLIRAAQVNRTWRTVLHGHPHLWTAMYLHCSTVSSQAFAHKQCRQAVYCNNQIQFYEDRLPEDGPISLKTLIAHLDADVSQYDITRSPVAQLRMCRHRFIPKLRNISIAGTMALDWIKLLCGRGDIKPLLPELRCVRVTVTAHSNLEEGLMLDFLMNFAKLQSLEILSESLSTAESVAAWPTVPESDHLGMTRLVVRGRTRTVMRREGKEHCLDLAGLQHLDIGNYSFSHFFTHFPLTHLRTLSLNNTLFNPSYSPPPTSNPFNTTDPTFLNTFLETPLDFPHLETLKIVYTDNEPGMQEQMILRHKIRPTLYFCRLKAPNLRHLVIKNFGPILSTAPSMHAKERQSWIRFCDTVPQLEELVLSKTTIVDLGQSLHCLPKLTSLILKSVDLPSTFLKSATSPALPLLRQLSVSHCSNITSGDLLRLVQSKNGTLDYLDIEGCTELQKEAVDWLKDNVKQVKWSGWSDKNDRRAFSYRS